MLKLNAKEVVLKALDYKVCSILNRNSTKYFSTMENLVPNPKSRKGESL
jgi:hypothetical protein